MRLRNGGFKWWTWVISSKATYGRLQHTELCLLKYLCCTLFCSSVSLDWQTIKMKK